MTREIIFIKSRCFASSCKLNSKKIVIYCARAIKGAKNGKSFYLESLEYNFLLAIKF